jgi:hypothetical protein
MIDFEAMNDRACLECAQPSTWAERALAIAVVAFVILLGCL